MEQLQYPQILKLVENGDSDAVFQHAADRLKATIGYRLFTVLVPDTAGTNLRRIFTTDPHAYPLGPADEVTQSRWFVQLFEQREPIVASNAEEIARWLPGFGGFAGTGLDSLVNYPLVVTGETIGLINLMDRSGSYGDGTVRLLEQELLLPVIAIATLLRSA